LASLHLVPGNPVRHPIATPVSDLAEHMLMHYTGVAHFSGTNNWEMYKRQIQGMKKVQKGFAKIAATSIEMEHALETADWEAAGRALAKEWATRKALIDGISTPEIDAAIDAAAGAGAWGGKVCGAGGGGCVIFLMPAEKRDAVARALATVPGRVLEAAPVAHGMIVTRDDATQSSSAPARSRLAVRARSGTLDQLYVSGGDGDYLPYVLAESVITHIEGRSGTHHAVSRAYIAPISRMDGTVDWSRASHIDPEQLDIRAVPDPDRKLDVAVSAEALAQAAGQGEEAFKQFVSDTERTTIFHNPAFALFSTPDETRQAFLERCHEAARRMLDDEAERLESTFRRRIDQVKERSDREARDSDDDTADTLPWGQALYNITSGRPAAAVADAPQSVRETDYLEKIAQIQRAWDKELESRREDLTTKARGIEEIAVIPTPRNIEVTKYLILWAAGLA